MKGGPQKWQRARDYRKVEAEQVTAKRRDKRNTKDIKMVVFKGRFYGYRLHGTFFNKALN